MAIIDKVQATVEKLTKDDKRMTSAEITAVQNLHNVLQLAHLKLEFYVRQTKEGEVRDHLEKWRDELVKPNMDKPRRMLEKAGIPHLNLNAEERVAHMTSDVRGVFRDEEILLDAIYTNNAFIMALDQGALTAVRGDVRDLFLNMRDTAWALWRQLTMLTYKNVPGALPPTMTGIEA